MQDGRCIVAVDVVDDCLLAHALQTLNAKEISCLKELHHVVQSDLTLVCVQVGQHLNQHIVPYLLESDGGSGLVGLLVQRSFLEHGGEVGATRQE